MKKSFTETDRHHDGGHSPLCLCGMAVKVVRFCDRYGVSARHRHKQKPTEKFKKGDLSAEVTQDGRDVVVLLTIPLECVGLECHRQLNEVIEQWAEERLLRSLGFEVATGEH